MYPVFSIWQMSRKQNILVQRGFNSMGNGKEKTEKNASTASLSHCTKIPAHIYLHIRIHIHPHYSLLPSLSLSLSVTNFQILIGKRICWAGHVITALNWTCTCWYKLIRQYCFEFAQLCIALDWVPLLMALYLVVLHHTTALWHSNVMRDMKWQDQQCWDAKMTVNGMEQSRLALVCETKINERLPTCCLSSLLGLCWNTLMTELNLTGCSVA